MLLWSQGDLYGTQPQIALVIQGAQQHLPGPTGTLALRPEQDIEGSVDAALQACAADASDSTGFYERIDRWRAASVDCSIAAGAS